ncbi:MAG: cell division protein ZapA [Acidobacteriota bacterium]|jgi:cell division protein ZapA
MSEEPEYVSVRVKIYDRDYTLRTQGDPERLRAVCADLDKRMREVAASTGAVDTFKVAVLAAISLADDLQRSQDELKKFDESVGRRSIACVSMLERALK